MKITKDTILLADKSNATTVNKKNTGTVKETVSKPTSAKKEAKNSKVILSEETTISSTVGATIKSTTPVSSPRLLSEDATKNAPYVTDYAKKVAKDENYIGKVEEGDKVPFSDGGASKTIISSLQSLPTSYKNDTDADTYKSVDFYSGTNDAAKSLAHYIHIPGPSENYEARMYDSIFRFGAYNTSSSFSTGKEFLFFTRPDLHIFMTDDRGEIASSSPKLNPGLRNGFWADVASSKKRIIKELQEAYAKRYKLGGTGSRGAYDPFCHLLSNQCTSNLDIPSLSANAVETSTNMYGVGFSYRGSSEESDDQVEFSLEFKDTKYLDIYYYFKCYEEYETEKHHGTVRPAKKYIIDKVLHDQFAIYKFIVDEDMETLIYWGKFYGVMPMSLPRDTFSSDNFESGLSYSINFKAAFYEDMRPEILSEFNRYRNI